MKLSVVIPARNEAGSIRATLDELRRTLAREGIQYEIVVVDDGSTDATAQEVEACRAKDPGIRLVGNPSEHGFGRAVRHGLSVITGDAVIIVMADGSDDPEDIVEYYYILRDKAECAFGSRFMRGSRVDRYP